MARTRPSCRLQERTAELLGKEAALFVPSGTMANQIAVGVHARPGDELLCDPTAHVYVWEGRRDRPALGRDGPDDRAGRRAARPATTSRGKIRPDDAPLCPDPARLPGEHPQPRRAARSTRSTAIAEISGWARAHGLAMHLDGARLMNAVVAAGIPASGVGQLLRHGLDLLLEGAGRAGRLGPGRLGRRDPRGPPAPQGPRRRDAAGRDHRRRGALRPGPPRRPPGRGPRERPDPGQGRRGDAGPLARIRPGRDQPRLDRGRPRRSGTAAEVAGEAQGARACSSAPSGAQVIRACTHLDVSASDVDRRRRGHPKRGASRSVGEIRRHAADPHIPGTSTPAEARALQAELAGEVDTTTPLGPWRTLAAADVSFDRGERRSSTPPWWSWRPRPSR